MRRSARLSSYVCLLPVFFCWLLLSGCGKVGNPLPPLPRSPLLITELTATQQGASVLLSFPVTRTPRFANLQRADIYRLIEPTSAALGVTEDDFSTRATIIASIPAAQIPTGASVVTYVDPIDFKVAAGRRFRYAVRLVNPANRATDFSNYALLAPLSEVALPPTDLRTRLSQTEIALTWSPPQLNLGGGAVAGLLGYNVYRRTGSSTVKLNPQPLREPRLVDRQFQFGTAYEYTVRSVSLPTAGAPISQAVESDPSAPLALTPKDTFAPSAPASITIASVGGVISLFWPANPEPDVVGYNVYRAEEPSLPAERWVKLGARPITTITFSDKQVRIGSRYYYQITAIDNAGNESARSETQSEIVNP